MSHGSENDSVNATLFGGIEQNCFEVAWVLLTLCEHWMI
jgi:hypothetical protein